MPSKDAKVTPEQIVQGVLVAAFTSGTIMTGMRLWAFRRNRGASADLEKASADVKSGEAWEVAFKELRATVEWQGREMERLRIAEADYRKEKAFLEGENLALREQVRSLTARVADLERQLGAGQ